MTRLVHRKANGSRRSSRLPNVLRRLSCKHARLANVSVKEDILKVRRPIAGNDTHPDQGFAHSPVRHCIHLFLHRPDLQFHGFNPIVKALLIFYAIHVPDPRHYSLVAHQDAPGFAWLVMVGGFGYSLASTVIDFHVALPDAGQAVHDQKKPELHSISCCQADTDMGNRFSSDAAAIVGSDALLTATCRAVLCDKAWTLFRQCHGGGVPSNTRQVAEIIKLCAANRIAIVPQGGNTGLCGASVPLSEAGKSC